MSSGVVTASLLPEPAPRRRHDEENFQKAAVRFMKWCLPADAVVMAIPNGGQRHTKAAARLVGQGVVAGAPDLLCVYRGRAIFLELKTKTGRLSEVQKQFHRKLIYCGADVMCCRSLEEVEASLREACVPLRGSLA